MDTQKKILLTIVLLAAAALLIFFLLSGNKAKAATPPADGGTVPPVPQVTPRFTPEEEKQLMDKGKSITDTLGPGGKVVQIGNKKVYARPDGSQVNINNQEALEIGFFNKRQKILGNK